MIKQAFRSSIRPVRGARRRARRGVETLQLIIALPLLVIALVAAIQYGIVMIVLGAVTHAATVGARETGKGVNDATVVAVVDRVLAVHGILIGPNATVIVERKYPSMAQTTYTSPGGVACSPVGPVLSDDQVRVTVCVDITTSPMLNSLSYYGLNFTGKHLVASSVSTVE